MLDKHGTYKILEYVYLFQIITIASKFILNLSFDFLVI